MKVTSINPNAIKGPIPSDPSQPAPNVSVPATQPSNWPGPKAK